MVSSYLKRPLRALEQALEDRTRVRPPAALSARAADPVASEPGPVDLLAQLLSDGAPGGAHGDTAAPDRPPVGRRHAA